MTLSYGEVVEFDDPNILKNKESLFSSLLEEFKKFE